MRWKIVRPRLKDNHNRTDRSPQDVTDDSNLKVTIDECLETSLCMVSFFKSTLTTVTTKLFKATEKEG